MSILEKLREGTREHTITLIPGSDIKVALVALTNKEIIEANERAIKFIEDKKISESNHELILTMHILAEAMRNVEDLNSHLGQFTDVYENMEPYIVFELNFKYLEVQRRAIVELDNLSLDEFEEIKKKLDRIQMRDLDGELQKSLKNFLQMMSLKDLLKNK